MSRFSLFSFRRSLGQRQTKGAYACFYVHLDYQTEVRQGIDEQEAAVAVEMRSDTVELE